MQQTILTRSAYMWTRVLTAPFWAIYNILPIILYKDLGASPLQITIIYTLKPLVSIFSIYWSAAIARRPHLLVPNIIGAGIIGHLPFLFCPFIDSPWFFIASFALYMIQARGVLPAWMEILKLNIPRVSREKVFAYGSICGNLGNVLLPVIFAWFLDGYHQAWRFIFPIAAIISFVAIIFQLKIPVENQFIEKEPEENQLFKPWARSWKLLRQRRDFWLYQVGFMLGGVGLMIMQPALPYYFNDVLGLSYTELAIAFSLCKGLGWTLSSPSWARWMNRVDIYRFSGLVTVIAALFPLLLYTAQMNLLFLYFAYFIYGIMQGGSELSWNLSGPIFARNEDSIDYTNVNTLSVGLRGAFAPVLGGLIYCLTDSIAVLAIGALFCLLAAERLFSYSRKMEAVKVSN